MLTYVKSASSASEWGYGGFFGWKSEPDSVALRECIEAKDSGGLAFALDRCDPLLHYDLWGLVSEHSTIECAKVLQMYGVPVTCPYARHMLQRRQWDLLTIVVQNSSSHTEVLQTLAENIATETLEVIRTGVSLKKPPKTELVNLLIAATSRLDSDVLDWLLATFEFTSTQLAKALHSAVIAGTHYAILLAAGALPRVATMKSAVSLEKFEVVYAYLEAKAGSSPQVLTEAVQRGKLNLIEELYKRGDQATLTEHHVFEWIRRHRPNFSRIVELYGVIPADALDFAFSSQNLEATEVCLDSGQVASEDSMKIAITLNHYDYVAAFVNAGTPVAGLDISKASQPIRSLIESKYKTVCDLLTEG